MLLYRLPPTMVGLYWNIYVLVYVKYHLPQHLHFIFNLMYLISRRIPSAVHTLNIRRNPSSILLDASTSYAMRVFVTRLWLAPVCQGVWEQGAFPPVV